VKSKADDRRTIKLADFIGRQKIGGLLYVTRPMLLLDFLGEIRTSSTAKFNAEISADKIDFIGRYISVKFSSSNFVQKIGR